MTVGKKNIIQAHQPTPLRCRRLPSSTRQLFGSAADNWIRQQNGADEYTRGPAWEQGPPSLAWGLPLGVS